MPRSIYCCKCRKEKESEYSNESYCKSCKGARNKEKRARKRREKGLEPFGTGRSIYCYDCKAVKEVRSRGYCNACHAKRDKEWRLQTGRTKKVQTGLCPCGAERLSDKDAYCRRCRNEQSANWKRQHLRTPEQIYRNRVRCMTRYAVSMGYIEKLPCEVCNETETVEAHHDDYSKPYEIRWLCRKHHREHHQCST